MTRAALLLILALAACSRAPSGDRGPDTPGGRIGDPAIAAALNAPIMVDPGLGQISNADAIRPPTAPDPVPVPPDMLGMATPDLSAGVRHAPAPAGDCSQCRLAQTALTLGALAERQPRPGAACAATIRYATGWAERLPQPLPLPPGARVIEAAGSDAAGCALRVVHLAIRATPEALIDWYYTRASAAGFSADHQADTDMQVLSGGRGGTAYALYVTAQDGGSDATLVSWGG